MQKTKLGISVGLLGAILYFASLVGGYIVAIILFGYIMLVENNIWLRKTATKAIVLLVSFSILGYVVNFVPDILGFINSILSIFSASFSTSIVNSIFGVVSTALSILKYVVFILLGIKALNQGTISIPVVDGIADKNVEVE